MPSASSSLLSYLRIVTAAWRDDPRNDAELLARFAESRDEAAFATLVWRHGPLVWRTCRHILGETPDAEDAFQATFLALARKAGRFPVESLVGWLYRTARRAALDANAGARRRRGLEHRLRAVAQSATTGDADRAELYAVLDEELAGLPEKLRVALLLHYVEGKTQDEVAHFLGCSRGAVRKRLIRGEAILRQRLTGRGLGVSVVSVGALLASTISAPAVPTRLIGSTARAALRSLSFPLPESSKAAALAERVVKTMLVTKVKLVTVLLGLTLCLAGGGVLAYQALAGNAAEPLRTAGERGEETEAPRQPGVMARVDCYGDPLPEHALARMGTTRLWRGTARLWSTERSLHREKNTLAFSPDGKTLATNIDGMTVCLWDAATGKEIRRLTTKAIQGWIISLGFSPDGKALITQIQSATRDDEEMVCWWEIATGKFLRKQQYQGPRRDDADHRPVDFLPGGKMLGFVSFTKSIEEETETRGAYVWDAATGKEICQLNRPLKEWKGWNTSTVFSPDGKLLATVANDVNNKKATISLWEVATGKQIRQLIYKDGGANTVALSPDGKTLAAGGEEEICVWEVATGKKIHQFPRPQEGGQAMQVEEVFDGPLTYSPDGKSLVGGRAGHLWDVGTGKEICSFGWKEAQVALFSPNGKILATGDTTGSIRLWEVATGKEIGPRKEYRGGIQSIAYSPDGKTLATMCGDEGDKTVRLWEVATGKEMRPLAKNTTWGSGCIAYSPDGKMLVSMDDWIHLWDTTTGKEIRQFKSWIPNVLADCPRSVAFSPDGKRLAAILGTAKTVYLWEIATGKEIFQRPVVKEWDYAGNFVLLAFSPDGRLLAVPGDNNAVWLYEATTGELIGLLGGKKEAVRGKRRFAAPFAAPLAFSPDSRMLATTSTGDEKIHVWEVLSGKEIRQLDGYKPPKESKAPWNGDCKLAFSPDGRLLATAAQGTDSNGYFDPKIHLWETVSGKEIGRLIGHQAPVQALAFSPDGKALTSGSRDLTCLVWDLTSMDRFKPVPAHSFSPEQLEATWADLAQDPAKAFAALGTLQAAPAQAIALLRKRVRTVAPVADTQQLKRWIADLDDSNFAVREKAQREIEKLEEVAIPALRQALKDQPTLAVKRRLQDLLTKLELNVVIVSPERLRELRAVHVLESIGTAEARQLLQVWAKGVAGARLTMEAQAALARLTKRSAAKP